MPTFTILLLFFMAGPAQRIQAELPDRERVTRVETAIDHLTVIEMAEPIALAAAGSPLFRIERRDNKVFIQPLEEGASTNLFVWTGSGRWSYALVPPASPETTHFAIEQKVAPSPQSSSTVVPDSAATNGTISRSFAREMLLSATPIRNAGVKFSSTEVGVFVTDVYRKDDQLFIRYVIDNRTMMPYAIGIPEVFAVDTAHSQISLHALRYSQVGRDIDRKIRSRGRERLQTAEGEVPSAMVPPGAMASGILIVERPPSTVDPVVLRLSFTGQKREPIFVTLVL